MKLGKIKHNTILVLKECTKCKNISNHTSKGKQCMICVSKNSAKYLLLNKEHRKYYYSKWRDENIDKIKEQKKLEFQKYKKTNEYKVKLKDKKNSDKYKAKARDTNYKKKYNISTNIYNNMYESQDGKCDICKNNFDKLVVDHNHKTGKVRSLLCFKCNSAIGLLFENEEYLESAKLYIQKYK